MNKIRKICVISQGYPSETDPYFTFVEQLCREFSRQNIEVSVIAPQSWISAKRHKHKLHPHKRVDSSVPIPIKVYQPVYWISFPHRFTNINNRIFKRAVRKEFAKQKIEADVFYGHFWYNADAICPEAVKWNKPLFVAVGEGNLISRKNELAKPRYDELKKSIKGAICVSTNNKDISVKLGLISPDKTIVLPNAVDSALFYPRDKYEMRNKYGIDKNLFIVAFVGAFVNRKGPQRVSEAVCQLNDKNIGVIFIGGQMGSECIEPNCPGVLHKGKLPHDIIPEYLSMADVFVLPTLNEGCCNAVVEALACGLPVISSNLPFNWDVLNENNSIMIDPENINEISMAIWTLKEDTQKRKVLSEGALKMANSLSLENRAKRILDFMELS